MNFLQSDPQFCTFFDQVRNLSFGKERKLFPKRWLLPLFAKCFSDQHDFDNEPRKSTALMFSKTQLLRNFLAISNVRSTLHKRPEQDHLKGCPPSVLESLHQIAELSNVEIDELLRMNFAKVFVVKVNPYFFDAHHRENS